MSIIPTIEKDKAKHLQGLSAFNGDVFKSFKCGINTLEPDYFFDLL